MDILHIPSGLGMTRKSQEEQKELTSEKEEGHLSYLAQSAAAMTQNLDKQRERNRWIDGFVVLVVIVVVDGVFF